MAIEDRDERAIALAWRHENPVALATVIATWGSSPRPVGSHLVIDATGRFAGSVSGGCIEGAVVTEALEVIASKAPKRLSFDVADENAWAVGLSCGGAIEVFVQYVDDTLAACLEELLHAYKARLPMALLFDLSGEKAPGLQVLGKIDDSNLKANDYVELEKRQQRQQSGLVGESLFVRCYVPAYRLFIVGAVHIAKHLTIMAQEAGFDVTVIDPRQAFLTKERFPTVIRKTDWPDDVIPALEPDQQTAVVVLSHDPKIDDPALIEALKSPAFYIGALGSTRTHEKRLARLQEEGVEEAKARIYGPIGLALGGRAPAEIAVSILAQLIQQRYQQNTRALAP